MCVTFCHRNKLLYWNHTDCHPAICPVAAETHGRCKACRHRHEARCGLTNAPLPEAGGCCHYNVTLVEGRQEVTREMMKPLEMSPLDTEIMVLLSNNVPYELLENGVVMVDPETLMVPFTYGLGTEHMPDELIDWSAWFDQWEWCNEHERNWDYL